MAPMKRPSKLSAAATGARLSAIPGWTQKKGILHRNNVNRRKSRLTLMAARLIRAATEGGEHSTEVRAAAAGGAKGRGRQSTAARKAAAKPAPKAAAKPAIAAKSPATAKRSTAKAPPASGDTG